MEVVEIERVLKPSRITLAINGQGWPPSILFRGAANWMSTAHNPATGPYYVTTIENRGVRRSTQSGSAAQAANAARAGARGGAGGAGGGAGRGGGGARGGGGGLFNYPNGDPPRRYLRPLEITTGKIAWEVEQRVPTANYRGLLSTAGGVVFYSESAGALAAVDANKTGRTLWHFETSQPPKASPMTVTVNGRQYGAIASGANVLAFALPE